MGKYCLELCAFFFCESLYTNRSESPQKWVLLYSSFVIIICGFCRATHVEYVCLSPVVFSALQQHLRAPLEPQTILVFVFCICCVYAVLTLSPSQLSICVAAGLPLRLSKEGERRCGSTIVCAMMAF